MYDSLDSGRSFEEDIWSSDNIISDLSLSFQGNEGYANDQGIDGSGVIWKGIPLVSSDFPTFINRDDYMKLYWGLNVMHQDGQSFIVASHDEVKADPWASGEHLLYVVGSVFYIMKNFFRLKYNNTFQLLISSAAWRCIWWWMNLSGCWKSG